MPSDRARPVIEAVLGALVIAAAVWAAGRAGARGPVLEAAGPALVTAWIAQRTRNRWTRTAAAAAIAAGAALALGWILRASPGAGYPALRAFCEGPLFAPLLTVAFAIWARTDHG